MIVLSCEEKGHVCKITPAGFEYVESGGTKTMSDNHMEQGIRTSTEIPFMQCMLGPN